MLLTRLRMFAQAVGFAIMGALMIAGAMSIFRYADYALGAPMAAKLQNAQLALQQQESGVPPLLNYAGELRDSTGQLMSGTYTMTFRIYAAKDADPSQALWSEVRDGIEVKNGRFALVLGERSPLASSVFSGPDRYFGLSVDSTDGGSPISEDTPNLRKRFAMIPFAAQADHASHATELRTANGDTVDSVLVNKGLYFSQSSNASDGLPFARLIESFGMRFTSPDTRWVLSSGPSVLIGYAPDGRTWGEGDLLVRGNIGIGTDTPVSKFDFGASVANVDQIINIYSSGNLRSGIGMDSATASQRFYIPDTRDEFFAFGTVSKEDGKTWAEQMRISNHGDVDIKGNLKVGGAINDVDILVLKEEILALKNEVKQLRERVASLEQSSPPSPEEGPTVTPETPPPSTREPIPTVECPQPQC